MRKPRNDDDDDWWYAEIAACSPGQIGSVSTLTELPPKRRQKVYRRRMGFLVDIDELIEAD
jgi:hypothetical protein